MGVDGINLTVHAVDVGDSGNDIELLGEISGEEGGESDEEHEWEQDEESGTDVSDSGLDNDETLAQPLRGVDEVNRCTAATNKVSEPPAPEHKSADSRSIQEKLDQDKIVSLKNDPKIKLFFKEMLSELGGKSPVNRSIHKDRPKTIDPGQDNTKIKSPSDTTIYAPALRKMTPTGVANKVLLQSDGNHELPMPSVFNRCGDMPGSIQEHPTAMAATNDVDNVGAILNQMHLLVDEGEQGAMAGTMDGPQQKDSRS